MLLYFAFYPIIFLQFAFSVFVFRFSISVLSSFFSFPHKNDGSVKSRIFIILPSYVVSVPPIILQPLKHKPTFHGTIKEPSKNSLFPMALMAHNRPLFFFHVAGFAEAVEAVG